MILYLLYRLFDYRHVYLGKTTRSARRFKIGIAKDVKQRWSDIDRQISFSKERPVFHARCLFAGRIEKALHQKYAHRRVKEKGWGREWFRLSILARLWVIWTIITYSLISTALLILGGLAAVISLIP